MELLVYVNNDLLMDLKLTFLHSHFKMTSLSIYPELTFCFNVFNIQLYNIAIYHSVIIKPYSEMLNLNK